MLHLFGTYSRNTNFHMEDQNIFDGICQKDFFHEFLLDCSSRDHNLHQHHRKIELIYLHNVCIECIHTWLQWCFHHLFCKGALSVSMWRWNPFLQGNTAAQKRANLTKLFPSINDWNTECTCPTQNRHSVQLHCSETEKGDRKMLGRKRPAFLFIIAAWLTFHLAKSLLYRIFIAWGRHWPSESR